VNNCRQADRCLLHHQISYHGMKCPSRQYRRRDLPEPPCQYLYASVVLYTQHFFSHYKVLFHTLPTIVTAMPPTQRRSLRPEAQTDEQLSSRDPVPRSRLGLLA
jgi:hypothetical protein